MQRIDDVELMRIAVFHLHEAARRIRLLARQAGSPELAAGLADAREALEEAAAELEREVNALVDDAGTPGIVGAGPRPALDPSRRV